MIVYVESPKEFTKQVLELICGFGKITNTRATDENTSIGEIKYSYCHCDPNFIVSEGDYVCKGQIIGYVGPKYVYNEKGNPYSDENGIPTNGATTGPHLHFGIRINDQYVDPLNFLSKQE